MNDLKNIFFRKSAYRIILNLENNMTSSELCRKIRSTTYSWLLKILDVFEEKNIIKTRKEGRTKIIRLTKKGKEVKKYIQNILELMENAG